MGSYHIKLFLLFIFCYSHLTYAQEYLNNGLYFSSHEVIQDHRTTLNLNPGNPFNFKKGFSIEFEAKIRRGDGYYGHIFRIIGDENVNIDLVSNTETTQANFWLVVKDSILFSYKWSDIPKGKFDTWMQFKLEIDPDKSSISLAINGDNIVKEDKNLEGLEGFDITFGKSNYKNFTSSDVCPMSLKNIKIFDPNEKLVRNWILGNHTQNSIVYDEIINDVAIVNNPKWLIDQHVFWEKDKDFQFNDLLGTAQDKEGERIFFIDREAVHIYSLSNQHIDTLKYSGNPLRCQSDEFNYNPYTNELWAYSIDMNTYNKFDFENLEWSFVEEDCIEPNFWHHNKIISPKDSTLITFGGYGFYRYKNDFKKFDKKINRWSDIKIKDTIDPRYLSSSGVLNENHFLIFGGYGSKTGRQEINIQSYYDLYSVSFDDFRIKKLWDVKSPEFSPFVPLTSMVVDSNSDSFYTLLYDNSRYNTRLKLARFGIEDFDITVFPDSIPYEFLDIKSNALFFLNSKKTKLYTITSIDNKASLHSLTYPPLLSSEVFQKEPAKENILSKYFWILIIPIAIIIYLIIRSRKEKSAYNHIEHFEIDEEIRILLDPEANRRVHSAIYLFGGFQVFDKDGNDITNMFTSTLKQLFLLILLSSSKKEKGISSFKLTEFLWYDKTENNAKNNRNVNIRKLRIILEKIGDIEINNETAYWRINAGEDVYCDYMFVQEMTQELSKGSLEKDKIYQLIKAVSPGEICPDIQTEWIDIFKVKTSNILIDSLEQFASNQNELHLLVLVADTILIYGPLNDNAIMIKCRALYKLGKKGLALHCYDNYCKEYQSMLDTPFNVSFKDIISNSVSQ